MGLKSETFFIWISKQQKAKEVLFVALEDPDIFSSLPKLGYRLLEYGGGQTPIVSKLLLLLTMRQGWETYPAE